MGRSAGAPRRTGGVVRGAVGAFGEGLAARHLADRGMVVLDRNWRCELGEIDIVVRDGDTLVVCEVKTRRGDGFGTPAEAVTRSKQARLRRLAARWLAVHGVAADGVRIDVVAVTFSRSTAPSVEHLVGVC